MMTRTVRDEIVTVAPERARETRKGPGMREIGVSELTE